MRAGRLGRLETHYPLPAKTFVGTAIRYNGGPVELKERTFYQLYLYHSADPNRCAISRLRSIGTHRPLDKEPGFSAGLFVPFPPLQLAGVLA